MDNISKEDIDYIFQKGTDRNEFPFKESAWDNMEAMLEADDKKRIYRRYALIGLLLFTVSAISYNLLVKGNKEINKEAVIQAPIATIEKNGVKDSQNTFSTSINENSIKEGSDSNTKVITNEIKNNSVVASTKNTKSENLNNKLNPSNTSNSNTLIYKPSSNISEPATQIPNNITTTILKENYLEYNNELESTTDITPKDIALIENVSNNRKNLDISNLLPSTPTNLLSFNDQANFGNESINLAKLKNNRLSYNLILAQDWSSVGTMSNSKRGFRFGVELAYQFARKFQVGAGFIVSQKHYETSGENYTPQAQFRWVSDAPQIVSGSCNIFEIPLEMTYYFKGYDRNSFFVTAGVSSYIMNNEWYDFVWEDQAIMADPNIAKSRSSAELDRKCLHLFGVGTVNAGYQKYLNKNIAVQIGPYVQLPYTGIGMGSVDLFSTGLQMKIAFAK